MTQPQAYKKSSFGPAFFFLNRRERQALAHYYAFCRLADDIADEPNRKDPTAALDALAQEIEYIYIDAPKTAWGADMLEDIRFFKLPKDRFTLLIEGMRADLEKKRYATFEKLDWYLYRVAVIVGKATLDILGIKNTSQANELAYYLGCAVQLTNIVRDVYDDARMGRVYLPCELRAQDILSGQHQAEVKKLLEKTADRAHECYIRAFEFMECFWPTKMLPCRIMGYTYQKNLAKIEKTGFSFTQTIKLSKPEKLQMVLYAIFKTLF